AMSTMRPRLNANAVTVADVRRGARPADCCAKAPGTPASDSGRPRARVTHGMDTGPSKTNATRTATAPRPTRSTEPAPTEPSTSAGADAAAERRPATTAHRPRPPAPPA